MVKLAKPYQQPGLPLDPLTTDEIIERYYGQTVIMQVTASEQGWPSAGYVLAVGAYQEIMDLWVDFPRTDTRGQPHYCFHAVPRIRTYDQWTQLLDQLADQDAEEESEWGLA